MKYKTMNSNETWMAQHPTDEQLQLRTDGDCAHRAAGGAVAVGWRRCARTRGGFESRRECPRLSDCATNLSTALNRTLTQQATCDACRMRHS